MEREEVFLLEVIVGTVRSIDTQSGLFSGCVIPAVSCRFLDFSPFIIHYFSTALVNEIKEKAVLHNITGDAVVRMIRDVLSFSPDKVCLCYMLTSILCQCCCLLVC